MGVSQESAVPAFGALAGLKVVDLTQMLAGPFCTMLLADQGAEVVKVEPLAGDPTRDVPPFRADDAHRIFGGYFQSVNRNKKSIAIDIKSKGGRELLLRLIEDADVVVENFRAGVMDRNGVGYETMKSRNPRLVYASIRGFGDPRTGPSPYVNWPAYDVVAQAMGGVMGITGPDRDTPTKVGPGVGDIFPAVMASFGILAAVYRARESGAGQYVDVGMVDCMLALCERIIHQHSFAGTVPRPEGNRHPLLAPFGMVPAKDGWITIACHKDEFWAELCRLIGEPGLVSDPRYATNELRLAHVDDVYGVISRFTRERTKSELMGLFGGRFPFGPVLDVGDIELDPHFRARDMIVEVEHPGSATPTRIAGVPIRMSETPGGVHRRAPLLGEHSNAILTAIGLTPEQIAAARSAGSMA